MSPGLRWQLDLSLVALWSHRGHTLLTLWLWYYQYSIIWSNIYTFRQILTVITKAKRSYWRETVYRSSELSRFQTYSQCAVVRGQRSGHTTASQSPDDGGSIMTIRWRLQTKVDEENIVVHTIYDIFVKLWNFKYFVHFFDCYFGTVNISTQCDQWFIILLALTILINSAAWSWPAACSAAVPRSTSVFLFSASAGLLGEKCDFSDSDFWWFDKLINITGYLL